MADIRLNLIQCAAGAINLIDDSKLALLGSRLAQHIVHGKSGDPFTELELSRLESSLEMSATDIKIVIAGITQMLKEAAYHRLAPNLLETHLTRLELSDSKAAALGEVWAKTMSVVCESLRQKSVLPQVGHIAYNLSVEAGTDNAASEKNLKGHLQLGLKGQECQETLDLEFSHEQLYDLHSQLTRIQAQLDAIADK